MKFSELSFLRDSFGLRRQSEAATALCQSGVALRLPPQSKTRCRFLAAIFSLALAVFTVHAAEPAARDSFSVPAQDSPDLAWWRESMKSHDERIAWWRELKDRSREADAKEPSDR